MRVNTFAQARWFKAWPDKGNGLNAGETLTVSFRPVP